MSIYTPDRWVVVKTTHPKHGTSYKILASWYGGYLGGDSWKLSSGNTSVTFENDVYTFPQFSKSTYSCHKNGYGMSAYTSGIYAGWMEMLAETSDGGTLEILPEDYDFIKAFTDVRIT